MPTTATADLIYPALFKALNTNASDFAKRVGLGKSAISNAIKRKSSLTMGTKQLILLAYPAVSDKWLNTGVGDIVASQEMDILVGRMNELTTEELSQVIASGVKSAIESNTENKVDLDEFKSELHHSVLAQFEFLESKATQSLTISGPLLVTILNHALKIALKKILKDKFLEDT